MTIQEAYDKLPEYLEGGLSVAEREALAELLRSDRDLAVAAELSLELDMAFKTQEWIDPSPGFTWMVLGHAGLVHLKQQPVWVTAWERAKTWVSVSTLFLTLAVFRDTVIVLTVQFLRFLGTWLDGLAGTSLFALHPVIVLGILSPIIVGGFATCVVTGRCKVAS
jgi:hypothetical protein